MKYEAQKKAQIEYLVQEFQFMYRRLPLIKIMGTVCQFSEEMSECLECYQLKMFISEVLLKILTMYLYYNLS